MDRIKYLLNQSDFEGCHYVHALHLPETNIVILSDIDTLDSDSIGVAQVLILLYLKHHVHDLHLVLNQAGQRLLRDLTTTFSYDVITGIHQIVQIPAIVRALLDLNLDPESLVLEANILR